VGESSRPPDCISLDLHRDGSHQIEPGVRWAAMGLLTVLVVAGLANVFGQTHETTTAAGGGVTLAVSAPSALRGGLIFQGRFEVVAARTLRSPTLALERGWFDAITLNTVQPEPDRTVSEDGGIVFTFGELERGRSLTLYLEFQVNPTTAGRRSQDVELRDGERTLARVDRSITIFP
jgi:hypothetical protein